MSIESHKLFQLKTRPMWDVSKSWTCEVCGLDLDLIINYNYNSDLPEHYKDPPYQYYEWMKNGESNWKRSYEQKIPSCNEVLMDTALE